MHDHEYTPHPLLPWHDSFIMRTPFAYTHPVRHHKLQITVGPAADQRMESLTESTPRPSTGDSVFDRPQCRHTKCKTKYDCELNQPQSTSVRQGSTLTSILRHELPNWYGEFLLHKGRSNLELKFPSWVKGQKQDLNVTSKKRPYAVHVIRGFVQPTVWAALTYGETCTRYAAKLAEAVEQMGIFPWIRQLMRSMKQGTIHLRR